MEGFLNIRLTPWLRRLVTRALAVVPAVGIIWYYGEKETTELLVGSQVVLSMQLGFAIWPLMKFTDDKGMMGEFANASWVRLLGWTVAGIIIALNIWLLFVTIAPNSVQKPVFQFLGWPVPN